MEAPRRSRVEPVTFGGKGLTPVWLDWDVNRNEIYRLIGTIK